MKQIKLAFSTIDRKKLLEEKLQREGKFPIPKILDAWTHNFCNLPEFSFGVCMQPCLSCFHVSWPLFYFLLIHGESLLYFTKRNKIEICSLWNELKSVICKMEISHVEFWEISLIFNTTAFDTYESNFALSLVLAPLFRHQITEPRELGSGLLASIKSF